MDTARNTSVEAPEPQKGWMSKLPLPIQNLIMAVGIGSLAILSEAKGDITITTPIHSGDGVQAGPQSPGESRQYFSNTTQIPGVEAVGSDTMTIHVPAADAGIDGCVLTVGGVSWVYTGSTGFSNQPVKLNHTLTYGPEDGTMTTLDLGTYEFNNNSIAGFKQSIGEVIDAKMPFSIDIIVPAGGGNFTLKSTGSVMGGDANFLLKGDFDNIEDPGALKISTKLIESATTDANDNGIYDTWEIAYFGNADKGSNPADGDPDHDGMNNLTEYTFGTDPTQPSASPLQYTLESSKLYASVSAPRNPVATNVVVTPEVSTDLQTWTANSPTISDLSDATSFKFIDLVPITPSNPQRFMRLKITSQK